VTWRTSAIADADGLARLRLPYATGVNGAVHASTWRLTDGRSAGEVALDEQAVLLGGSLSVTLVP
jgi:Archaeal glycosylation protein B long peripheral domain